MAAILPKFLRARTRHHHADRDLTGMLFVAAALTQILCCRAQATQCCYTGFTRGPSLPRGCPTTRAAFRSTALIVELELENSVLRFSRCHVRTGARSFAGHNALFNSREGGANMAKIEDQSGGDDDNRFVNPDPNAEAFYSANSCANDQANDDEGGQSACRNSCGCSYSGKCDGWLWHRVVDPCCAARFSAAPCPMPHATKPPAVPIMVVPFRLRRRRADPPCRKAHAAPPNGAPRPST